MTSREWFSAGSVAAAITTGMASWFLTRFVLRHAIRNGMLDIPNERSLHESPTPRGGGVAIVTIVLLCIAVAGSSGLLEQRIALALCGGGLLVAGIGWIDDRRNVSAAVRAAVHCCAAAWAVYWLDGLTSVRVGVAELSTGFLGSVAAIVAIVWMTNLYNFMDGIDGLAAVEAVCVAGSATAILLLTGAFGFAVTTACIAGAAAGFLVWNRMPARIFMGDVGSGFLGFTFATLAFASESETRVPAVVWLLLMLVFIFDATATLLRRVLRGERWYAGHRQHAYQRLVQSGLSHSQVVAAVVACNLVLGGLAAVTVRRPGTVVPVLFGALLLVAAAYLAAERRRGMWHKAGP